MEAANVTLLKANRAAMRRARLVAAVAVLLCFGSFLFVLFAVLMDGMDHSSMFWGRGLSSLGHCSFIHSVAGTIAGAVSGVGR